MTWAPFQPVYETVLKYESPDLVFSVLVRGGASPERKHAALETVRAFLDLATEKTAIAIEPKQSGEAQASYGVDPDGGSNAVVQRTAVSG